LRRGERGVANTAVAGPSSNHPVIYEHDAVRNIASKSHLVRYDQHRSSGLRKELDRLQNFLDQLGIKRRHR
jgi:hypothetical protein